MNAAEGAVAHAEDRVARTRLSENGRDKRLEVVGRHRLFPEGPEYFGGIPRDARAPIAEDLVCVPKALGETVLHRAELHRVAARLQNREDASRRLFANGPDRLLDRGRMVREVVDHRDAPHDAADFLTALDAREIGEQPKRGLGIHADRPRGRDGGERIETVVAPRHGKMQFPENLAREPNGALV